MIYRKFIPETWIQKLSYGRLRNNACITVLCKIIGKEYRNTRWFDLGASPSAVD
jgi:hypothetical protein